MPDDRLKDLGEDRVIAALTARLSTGSGVIAAAGDDCAVLGRRGDRMWTLLKTDCLIETVHFTADTPPRRIGWKAMARNISDIAAMGGQPKHAVVTVAASGDTRMARLRGIYAGLDDAARKAGAAIVGGETSRSPGPLFLSIALTGEVSPERCIFRSGGKPGDALLVTGRLGGSLKGRHLDFQPRLEEGRWLAARKGVHAMMDLSDGLGADLPRMAAAGRCGFELDESAVPRNRGASVEAALSDGEDYELLIAAAPELAKSLQSAWQRRFPKLPLTRIGTLSRRQSHQPSLKGHDHFA